MALGGGGGARDIRAGGAFVELFAKDGQLRSALARAKQLVLGFGSTLKQVGVATLGLGLTLAAPFVAAVKHFASYGDQLNKASQRTGISVESLSELAYAAGQSGASIEDLESGIKAMQRVITGADEDSAKAQKSLAMLGLTVDELVGLKPEQQFLAIAEALSKVEDASRRSAIAQQVFRGTQLLPLIEGGAKGIAELRQEARDLGATVTKDQAESATAVGDAWDRVWAAIKGGLFSVGDAIAPALLEVLHILKLAAVAAADFVRQNRTLVVIVAAVSAGLIVGGAALATFGFLIHGIVAGLGALATVAGAVVSVLGFFITWPGILALAVAAVVGFTVEWRSLGETMQEAWSGMVAAIQKGDLQAAFRVVGAALRLEWAKVVAFWTTKWADFKELIGGDRNRPFFKDLKHGAKLMLTDIGAGIVWAGAKAAEGVGAVDKGTAQVIREDWTRERNRILDESERDWREMRDNSPEAAARRDLELARQAFEEAVRQAKAPVAPKKLPDSKEGSMAQKAIAELPKLVKGAFQSPSWQQAFGVADTIARRQLAASEQTAKNTEITNALLKALPVAVFK